MNTSGAEYAGTRKGACHPLHIRTHVEQPKRSDYALGGRTLDSHISWYEEGSRARVQRQLVEQDCLKCGKPFTVEEYRADSQGLCRACRGWGGKRGSVSTFSEDSRRRLIAWLNALKPDVRPLFLTLTYSDAYRKNLSPLDWKACLKRF